MSVTGRGSRLVALLVAAAIMAAVGDAAAAADKAAAIDALVVSYQDLGLFNGSVLVAEKAKVVLKKGYGPANAEWGIPNTPDTVFRLGSITKQFSAMLVMQLVQEGRLTLDTRLFDVLPTYRKDTGSKVTIRQLLNHTSGIPSYTDLPGFMTDASRTPYKVEDFVAKYCSGDLQFEPGSKFHYDNSGYFLLGAVIEKVTSKPYEEVLADRITGPLGMRSTGYDHTEEIIRKRASGYQKGPNGLQNARYIDMSVPFAAGALCSTVEDLFLWDQALYTDKLLSPQLKGLMFTPGLENYAFGWSVRQAPVGPNKEGRTLNSHAGGIPGFSSFITRVVEDRHLVVLLDNAGDAQLAELSAGILDILYGRTPPPPRRPIGDVLSETIAARGIEAARAQYRDLKRRDKDAYDFSEPQLNVLGYQLLAAKNTQAAIAIFTLNVEAYPESWNVYDSLAEAYVNAGQKEPGIANYKKSLELNPSNANAVQQLAKLTKP
jgi:CubicO group peptidase (beta-lactamase class C family)